MKRLALLARRLLPLVLLGGCSPVTILNNLAPKAGVAEHDAIAYAPGPRHVLDVYAPTGRAAAGPVPGPVVVFIYGGGWNSGDRGMYRFVGAELAAHGVLAIVPDMRLYPQVRFPGFVQDCAAAVAWVRAHAAEYGGDPHRLFLMGHSAGGQIATLLALDPEYLAAVGMEPKRDLAGVIGLAGPYDFLPLKSAELRAIFGPPSEWKRSQPIDYVSAQSPPMLLLAGSADDTVDPGNTTRLSAALRSVGVGVQDSIYPGVGHKELIGAMASTLDFIAPVLRDVLRYVGAPVPASR